ncbi:UDP-2,3-diacylglucosamine diphosphatase [Propionivibrio dicarboxylicus]|uniref:UDP-2,3-diacylglucosamine hydrolase n=1 Tax=Propionivibrio dicarboxylicus TaxID=83767 RepID=A0A1G7XPT7_9RHOO|nr:UDP-2,3-diacylglucosamine diphosphatase [Propionivibrio dicarboxylicus]SDG85660.1 UDP-2,3-diacylglucosamine hydrolase [Propionivibrio dicarboxylicus]
MIHFISDLHLSSDTPGIARRFLHYLEHDARSAEQLFILGDLFEAWPGDDCLDEPEDHLERDIAAALRRTGDAGVKISVMHGNRDFMLGEDFARRCGARLLPDPFLLPIDGGAIVLSHGDALCTDDIEYQAFRAKVRHPAFRAAVLSRPLSERKATAAALRQQSEQAKQEKNAQGRYSSDLNREATDAFLREHGCIVFIHGHTHQPATHTHQIEARTVERWVLADWTEIRGEYLAFDGRDFRRCPIQLPL